MISIGEYLADMDLQRKGAPLSMLLLRHPEWESCMPKLPAAYCFVKPLMRPIYLTLLARHSGRVLYWNK